MCGRCSLIADLGELARRFEFDGDWLKFEAAYNVARYTRRIDRRGRRGQTRRVHALGADSALG